MLQAVMNPATKRFGTVYPATPTEYAVEVVKNKSIVIFRDDKLANVFQIGDEAEYDSYNLSYTGEITAITDKTVTIVAYKGSNMERVHRLNHYQFCWRNWDFDAEKVAAKNADTMMYI